MVYAQRFGRALGPGILFAGTAIGVSHLVQSTRAGADYGLAMLGILLLVNAIKYPAFLLAPHYVAVTGESLVTGYRRRGRAVLVLYGLALLPTLCTVVAAVAITMAGLASATLGAHGVALPPPPRLAALFVALAVAITLAGGFAWLDRLTKLFVAFLTLATVAATLLVLPRIDWGLAALAPPPLSAATIAFLVALAGYMPAGLDLSVMHSLWSVARAGQTGYRATPAQAAADFNLGFGASTVLAVCFLLMGTALMHQTGVVPQASAPAFAAQVIGLYQQALGAWSGVLVGIAAFLVLLTTLLAVTDGFPRVAAAVVDELRAPATVVASRRHGAGRSPAYTVAMLLIAVFAVVLLLAFMGSFRTFIDLVTTVGFITSPVIALLNHLAVFGPDVPPAQRPGTLLRRWSELGILAMAGFALAFAYLSLSGSMA